MLYAINKNEKKEYKNQSQKFALSLIICIIEILNYVDISYLCESIIKKIPLTGGQESISMYPMYVWMFICVYMYPYLPINIHFYLYIHICLNLEKKWNQNQNCSHGKYEVKINGQNIFILQSMSNQGVKMHLQIIGWQFLFKFLLQGQLFLLTFWMLGFIYAAQHSMMNAKWNAWGKSTVKLNSDIIVSVMSKKSGLSHPDTCKFAKHVFAAFSSS